MRELGKYLILRFSFLSMSSASVRYQVIYLTVDSLVSPINFINLGTFHPLGSSVCNTYFDRGDV